MEHPKSQTYRAGVLTVVNIGLILLFAIACGAEGSGSDVVSDSAPTTSEAAEPDPTELGDTPLNDLLGIPITDEEAMREYEAQQEREIERLTAECMLAAGFDYKPVDYSQLPGATADDLAGTREFAEARGLGIASTFADMRAFEEVDTTDPNREIYDAMTELEREQYNLALWGTDSNEVEDDGFDGPPGGCQGDAFAQVFSVFEVLDSFGPQLDDLFDQFNSDPRIQSIRTDWSRCMSEAGFTFAGPDEMYAHFGERVSGITNSRDSFVDPDAAGRSVSEMEQNGAVVTVMGGSDLTTSAQAELDAIAAEERNAAVAGWDCSDVSRDTEAEILLEYEQQFVAGNGEKIKELLTTGG